jgi:hypothetical protein
MDKRGGLPTPTQAGTTACPHCGARGPAGRKFCGKCGGAIGNAAAPVTPVADASPVAQQALAAAALLRRKGGLKIWWIIIPTAIFIFLSREPVPIAIIVAMGAGLWIGRTKQIPSTADANIRGLQPLVASAPLLQIPIVFVALGGSVITVVLLTIAVGAAIRFHREWIMALEPWWQFQHTISPALRKPLAFGIPLLTGYYFGSNAGGNEWTYTLISVTIGIAIAFLLLFTPPAVMRRKPAT